MNNPNAPRIRIGGKTYSSLDELPPEVRQKLEQAMQQMRASGLLEDKNRDGIPDRFETSLRIAGWLGKLTGNPQLKERIQQQMKMLTGMHPPPGASSGPFNPGPSTGSASTPAPTRVAATTPKREKIVSRITPNSVIQRGSENPRAGTGFGEFLRKLVIVSAVVFAGYAALRMLVGN